jgi:hypothetical protein
MGASPMRGVPNLFTTGVLLSLALPRSFRVTKHWKLESDAGSVVPQWDGERGKQLVGMDYSTRKTAGIYYGTSNTATYQLVCRESIVVIRTLEHWRRVQRQSASTC